VLIAVVTMIGISFGHLHGGAAIVGTIFNCTAERPDGRWRAPRTRDAEIVAGRELDRQASLAERLRHGELDLLEIFGVIQRKTTR
jgi:hypothetical protein